MTKVKNLFSMTHNKVNKQYVFSLKIKKLRRMGLTPEELNELTLLRPSKFVKNKKKK